MKKMILILLGGIILMTTVTGCGISKNRGEIEELFEGFISLYPTKNLMDFFDKEGDRNQGFEEEDQGTWIISTYINKKQNEGVESEGVTLWFNRNTRQATGNYYIRTASQKYGSTGREYPVYYDETGLHLVGEVEDEELRNKIVNFQFLVKYVSLENNYIQSLELIGKRYNFEVPLYTLTYQLTNEEKNITCIKQLYGITQEFEREPSLYLEGTGGSEWGIHNRRTVRFRFDEEWSVYVNCDISFARSEGMK